MNETLNYESLLRLLTENKVKMIVIGAVAMNLRATDNVTYDLDICFERSTENIERLCRALAPHCPVIRAAFIDMMDFLKTNPVGEKFSTDFGDIDLLGEVPGLGDYQATLQFASIVQLEDFSVQALTLDGLIKAKEAANRPKDQLHLITLRALKKMEDEE